MKIMNAVLILALTALMTPALASADCLISAEISAQQTNNALGAYEYTMDFTWDMDTQYGLSHFNLMVDAAGGTCGCDDISDFIFFDTIAGTSSGDDACSVDYNATLECTGDPTIPNVDGILFKFEPVEADCEPGNIGSGTIVFYSDLAPANVDEEVIAMSDKGAHVYCYGTISGVFPALACNPVATETLSFGSLKSIYQ
jgi:hypothetical protein